jgi:deoxyribodipyrimidine photo-lyase
VISVVVFTRDLRVADNPALSAAIATSGEVIPLFVIDDVVVTRSSQSATRLEFLLASLTDLDSSLRTLGGALVVRRGPWAETVLKVARSAGAGAIHVAADVSGYHQQRLAELNHAARQCRIAVTTHPGVTIVPAGTLRPPSRSCYQVFTPYYRSWTSASRRTLLPAPSPVTLPADCDTGRIPALAQLTADAPARTELRGGEQAGLKRLREWSATALGGYDASRDDLAADQTSRLSAYLHLGCLSPLALEAEVGTQPGHSEFIRQLAWRDFFHQLLAVRPDAARRDYRDRGDEWADDPGGLAAWQAGQTGYPIVDAGMRQLSAEGLMHGRARMITASFLTKDLYLDWRLGAAHFMRHLLDGDVACNQLNWQWVAGTGTDTNRYRVFSPVLQSRRHDPDGGYIRRWVPELAHLAAGRIHEPSAADRRAAGYPSPLVDHRQAIAAYRARPRRPVRATAGT